ncbi:MAG: hypothetical protein ACFFCW_24045 [Candidatus Hodarchaeota archaeon]
MAKPGGGRHDRRSFCLTLNHLLPMMIVQRTPDARDVLAAQVDVELHRFGALVP